MGDAGQDERTATRAVGIHGRRSRDRPASHRRTSTTKGARERCADAAGALLLLHVVPRLASSQLYLRSRSLLARPSKLLV